MGRVQLFIKKATIGRLGYSAVPGAGKVWAQQGLRTQSECKHGNVEHSDNVHRCSACKQGKDTGQSTMLEHGNANTVMTQAKPEVRYTRTAKTQAGADVQRANKANPRTKAQYSDAAQAQ